MAYLFDHPGTVFYAIFMSFWGKGDFGGFFKANRTVLGIMNLSLGVTFDP
jgi:hypothetical protein